MRTLFHVAHSFAICCIVGCLWLSSANAQSNGIAISDQQSRSFTLPANSFTNQFFFDLPTGVSRFRVELNGNASSGDIDLFLRQGQSFISRNSFDQALSFDEISEYAQYWSISADPTEAILVTASSLRPPVAGRYFLSVFNGDNRASTATIKLILNPPVQTAQINVRFDLACEPGDTGCTCDLAPWNDPSPVGFNAPGNTGTTLGQKRRNALLAAAQSLASQISSEGTVLVQACWDDLGAGDVTTLAQAGPNNFAINDPTFTIRSPSSGAILPFRATPFLPRYSWTAIAPTGRALGGESCKAQGGFCGQTPDLTITFNSLIDTPQALGARSFYYGTTGSPGQNIDFGSVAIHEMTHGLGYVDLVSDSGAELRGRDDAYTRNLINAQSANPKSFSRLTDAERLSAFTSNNVQWVGTEALQRSGDRVLPGERGIRVHAPAEFSSGSSIGHLDLSTFGSELMAPQYSSSRNLGIAGGQLADIGWSNAPKAAPARAKFYAGNWFDPQRAGHGFDIEAAGQLGGYDRVLVTSYSYDAQGLPEYFISVGQIVDGVFLADARTSSTGASSSLGRYRYVNGASELVADFQGRMRIDFNEAANSAACTENGRSVSGEVASLSLVAANDPVTWCIQPLIDRNQRPAQDFTGHWYNEADPGWGMGIANALVNGKIVLLVIIYYPDAQGTFRWAFAQSDDYQSGQEINVFQRNGYCRNCARIDPVDIPAGKLKITLNGVEGSTGQANRATFNVNFQGPGGGTFARTDVPLVRLVERPREIQ